MAALVRIVPRHPVVAFMVIGLSAGFLTAAIRPIAEAAVLPYSLPLHGFLGGVLDVGVGAFLVTGSLGGRDGLVDLARRSVSWCPTGALVPGRAVHRSGLRDAYHTPSTAQARSPTPRWLARERWRKWPPSSCYSWCSSGLAKRSDSPDSSNTTGRAAITP